jgi:hypothetical protein
MAELDDVLSGYIKLYRCLLKKPVWKLSTPAQKVVLITLLLMANHNENEWIWQGQKFKCLPGQMITSLEEIKRRAGKGISIQSVRSALLKFAKLDFLTNESTKTGRLISIVNWELYQEELLKPTKQLTKTQQSTNKEVTTNKNNKNDKNDKNESNSVSNIFTPPTLEEVKSYCQERNKGVDPERWLNFYQAKGWMVGKNKMKDWKAAVRTWERDNGGSNGNNQTSSQSSTTGEARRYNNRPII